MRHRGEKGGAGRSLIRIVNRYENEPKLLKTGFHRHVYSMDTRSENTSMGDCNAILSAYTLYRHLG